MDPPVHSEKTVIVFTRFPDPGSVKTRLVPVLGHEGAAQLQKVMITDIISKARTAAAAKKARLDVFFTGGSLEKMQELFGSGLTYRPQSGNDIGQRLSNVFRSVFEAGIRRAVLVGSDCPGITPAMIEKALDALKKYNVVFGPALDGGYNLIGLDDYHQSMFEKVPWGGPDVLDHSIRCARSEGLKVFLLEELQDIDRPEDLAVLGPEILETVHSG